MAWGFPEYSNREYNLAGKVLIGEVHPDMDIAKAFEVINNWRSSHYRPLDTFQQRLRRLALEVDSTSLVVQRIKRLYSIYHKIERFPTMRLTQIQDIGGCRAIVSTIDHTKRLVNVLTSRDKKRTSRGIKHKLIDENDYIKNPKASGYRGVHLIFRYYSDKVQVYDGLKIEIQIRTYLQHAWATAVETIGLFVNQALKSSMGEPEWLRFFAIASSAMAAEEGMPKVPEFDWPKSELIKELKTLYSSLAVAGHLGAYSIAINTIDAKPEKSHFYLLKLNLVDRKISITGYKQGEYDKASEAYLAAEGNLKDNLVDAVLVSADSISTIKKAYPNYFVDTQEFIKFIERLID